MADKKKFDDTLPPEGADASELDPFAELTRIMGFDPREPVKSKAGEKVANRAPLQEPAVEAAPTASAATYADDHFEDDFGIDLERELLGEFESGEPANFAAAAQEAPVEAVAADLAAIEAEDDEVEPVEVEAVEVEVIGDPSQDAPEAVEFDAAAELESFGDLAAEDFAASVVAEVNTHDAELQAVEQAESDDDIEFDAVFAEDVGALEATFSSEAPAADIDEDVDALNAAFADVVASLEDEDSLHDDLEAAFAGQLEEQPVEAAAPEAPVAIEETEVVASEDDAPATEIEEAQEQPVAIEAIADDLAPVLDDEFVLDEFDIDLGDIDEAIGREMERAFDGSSTEPYVEAGSSETIENAFAEDFADLPAVEAAPSAPVQQAPVAASQQDGLADIDMDFEWEELSKASPAKAAGTVARPAGDGPPREDLDDLIAALDAVNSRPPKIVTGGSADTSTASTEVSSPALANMTNPYQNSESNSWRQPTQGNQQRAFAPEVETTEMFDQAYSLADDLELPEVNYDQPVPRADELDLEFDNLLNEISRGGTASRPVQAAVSNPPRYEPQARVAHARNDDFDFDAAFDDIEPVRAQPAHRAQPVFEQPVYREQTAHAADEFDDFNLDDQDFDDSEPAQPAYRSRKDGGGNRGMMIALLVGGVALLGGLGAFAMSWSGGNGAPVLVKADSSPVKVRPENPGGTSVPNQDSAVYDTVSRSGGAAGAGQERLISSTEKPIEIPLPNDADGDDIADLAKSEDRIEPSQASSDAAQDPLAVAPRKVRTMVVKPDGSLVPAEMPAAAAAPEPTVEEIAATPVGAPEQITTGATQVDAPVKRAAVAAPGGWAVQIASQPSEDGANKSLNTMGKRYADAIGGRGLHIVKAEVPGKGTYWRVRVAAASRDDAVNVCSTMKSAGGSCFVTR